MTSEGFFKASSNNLPKIDMFLVLEYIKNDDRFNAAEFRNVKATAATREAYGDSAIGYVEVKRENSICTLQCKICPKHKVRIRNYTVILVVDEVEEKIVDVSCKDCPASLGGCKHALAFLMWVHLRSEEPSPTDVTSYWTKPRLASVGTSLKYVMASDFGKQSAGPSSAGGTSTFVGESSFMHKVLTLASKEGLTGQVIKYDTAEVNVNKSGNKFDTLSVYKLMCHFISEGGINYDDFVLFAISKTKSDICKQVEVITRDQADSPIWHELRFGRITASKLYDFANCSTPDGTLVEAIIGAYKIRDTKHMQRGRQLEKHVLKTVASTLNMKFSKCGLFISKEFPQFGASPDAISTEYVVEIKCPSSEKTVKNYLVNGTLTNKFKAQINVQMFCAQRKKGIFCVADPNYERNEIVQIVYIDYDDGFLKELM